MASRQRGAALILMFLALLLLAVSVFALNIKSGLRKAETLRREHQSLHAVKQVLLAYAARRHGHESSNPTQLAELQLARPGELPCPDFNNDKITNGPDDYLGAACRHRVGWFVFQSFDHEPVIGEEASPLWYAVADNFYTRSGLGAYAEPAINTSTVPSMTLDGQPVVAVLFATGRPLAGQNNRGVANAAVAQSSFLEQENAATQDTFVSQSASDEFNDVVLGITLAELMRAVEKKAAFAIARRLNQYFLDNGSYPPPSAGGDMCDLPALPAVGDVPSMCAGASSTGGLLFPLPTATDAHDVWLSKHNWLPQFSYERLAANRIRLSSRYVDTELSPLVFEDALQEGW